jgi:hypothetical protein
MKKLDLSDAEYEHCTTAVEGAIEEFEELETEVEWFVTETVDRLQVCLEILRRAKP